MILKIHCPICKVMTDHEVSLETLVYKCMDCIDKGKSYTPLVIQQPTQAVEVVETIESKIDKFNKKFGSFKQTTKVDKRKLRRQDLCSNLEGNTNHRFISKKVDSECYAITIPNPKDTKLKINFSIGYLKSGENKALLKAIQKRNNEGKKAWGKYWKLLLDNPKLLTRMPHDLEPELIHKPRTLKNGEIAYTDYYIVRYRPLLLEDEVKTKLFRCDPDKLTAYTKARKFMMEVYKPYLGFIAFLDRYRVTKLL